MEYHLKIEKGISGQYMVSCENGSEPLSRSKFSEIMLILYQYASHSDRRNCFINNPTIIGLNDREKEMVDAFCKITLDSILSD